MFITNPEKEYKRVEVLHAAWSEKGENTSGS